MNIDRTIAPKIRSISSIKLPVFRQIALGNGIPMYILEGGTDTILKMELVFKAGRTYEKSRLVSKVCNHLLKEGTINHSSEEIAEKIDFYGSTISCSTDMDTSSVTLYCLKKHFKRSLDIVLEILNDATFSEEEINKYGIRSSQRLKQELSKNNVVAYRKLSAEIFGEDHPYGYNSMPDDYLNIDVDGVREHYSDLYTNQNCRIYLSGATDEEIVKMIDAAMDSFKKQGKSQKSYKNASSSSPKNIEIPGHRLQNSIKMGKELFNRHHEDYYPFMMLNTVLGGYFGSRLMSEIRENKGYTYSIYSMLDPLIRDGSFYVSTEVGKEYYIDTIEAIKIEFNKLKETTISDRELEMSKNYLLGNFLSMLDGPLKSSKILAALVENDLDFDHLYAMIEVIKDISTSEIRDLAVKYLDFDSMISVSVGDF